MRDCVKAEASWVCSYSCSAFLALKDQGSVTFAVSSFPLELNDSASRPLCRGPPPSRSAVPPASLFRSQVTQSSVVPGCHGFPTKCPGTSGAGFKSRPRPVLTHEGNASAATTTHPPPCAPVHSLSPHKPCLPSLRLPALQIGIHPSVHVKR